MATSKTLTPTNVTISIPDFTDRPDQRVTNNCIDKEADAINALNGKITNVTSVSLATGLTLYKLGNMRIISGVNGSGEIPSAGLDIGETVLTPCYSKIRYYNGTSNVDGYLYVNSNKVYVKSNDTSSASGTYITGSIVYFV